MPKKGVCHFTKIGIRIISLLKVVSKMFAKIIQRNQNVGSCGACCGQFPMWIYRYLFMAVLIGFCVLHDQLVEKAIEHNTKVYVFFPFCWTTKCMWFCAQICYVTIPAETWCPGCDGWSSQHPSWKLKFCGWWVWTDPDSYIQWTEVGMHAGNDTVLVVLFTR